MKNKNKILRMIVILTIILQGCNENILDQTPLDSYSDAIIWSDINLASEYLIPLYNNVNYGPLRAHGYQTGCFAMETAYFKGFNVHVYNNASFTADNLGADRGNLTWRLFSQIYQLNFFLANIEKVPDAYSESEKAGITARVNVLKGEALFLRAVYYTDICRSYGGVPLFDKPSQIGDDYLAATRSTFAETVDFIAKDFTDAASLLLPKNQMEMGRATKEAALALKSRILLFAASDLTADGHAANDLVGYTNPNRPALWSVARDAAKALIDMGTCKLADFGAPDPKQVARKYFDFFAAYDLSNDEVIWGKMILKDKGTMISSNRYLGPNGIDCWGNNPPFGNLVDLYEMEDGSNFSNHFSVINNKYVNVSMKFKNPNPYHNREPRFYASVLYDSAVWQPRSGSLVNIDPVGIYDRRTRIKTVSGVIVSTRYGLDTRQGPLSPQNGSYTGYVLKKFQDDKIIGALDNNQNIQLYSRYAEVLLDYAEASLELGDVQTATTYINKIRNRAGLPNFSGAVKTALQHERKVELMGENVRWYDERRWKTLPTTQAETPGGMDIIERNDDGVVSTTWNWIRSDPDNVWNDKLYWMPITTTELRKAPQLIQNPGY